MIFRGFRSTTIYAVDYLWFGATFCTLSGLYLIQYGGHYWLKDSGT